MSKLDDVLNGLSKVAAIIQVVSPLTGEILATATSTAQGIKDAAHSFDNLKSASGADITPEELKAKMDAAQAAIDELVKLASIPASGPSQS